MFRPQKRLVNKSQLCNGRVPNWGLRVFQYYGTFTRCSLSLGCQVVSCCQICCVRLPEMVQPHHSSEFAAYFSRQHGPLSFPQIGSRWDPLYVDFLNPFDILCILLCIKRFSLFHVSLESIMKDHRLNCGHLWARTLLELTLANWVPASRVLTEPWRFLTVKRVSFIGIHLGHDGLIMLWTLDLKVECCTRVPRYMKPRLCSSLFIREISSVWPKRFNHRFSGDLTFFQEDVSEFYTIFVLTFQASMGFSVVKVIMGVFLQNTFSVAANDDVKLGPSVWQQIVVTVRCLADLKYLVFTRGIRHEKLQLSGTI